MSRYGGKGPFAMFGYLSVLSVALILIAPTAVPTTLESVEGHTIFTQLGGYSECLAAVAGLAREKVLWFNDQILVDTARTMVGKKVYTTQHGAPDPREHTLSRSGKYYDFVDPNGFVWNVTEYTYRATVTWGTSSGQETGGDIPVGPGTPGYVGEVTGSGRAAVYEYYAWVVEIQDLHFDDNNDWTSPDTPNAHVYYNFVTLVDTCKFITPKKGGYDPKTPDGSLSHRNEVEGGWGHDTYNETEVQSDEEGKHTHETFKIDLYVGGDPKETFVHVTPTSRSVNMTQVSGTTVHTDQISLP